MGDIAVMQQDLGWDENKVIEAARSLRDLLGTREFQSLREVIDAQEELALHKLLNGSNPAKRDELVGELKGVRSVLAAAQGIIARGEAIAAEHNRATTEEAAA